MIIRIDDGNTFEGTLKQFQDCFFDNAYTDSIEKWCKATGSKVEFLKSVLVTHNSVTEIMLPDQFLVDYTSIAAFMDRHHATTLYLEGPDEHLRVIKEV